MWHGVGSGLPSELLPCTQRVCGPDGGCSSRCLGVRSTEHGQAQQSRSGVQDSEVRNKCWLLEASEIWGPLVTAGNADQRRNWCWKWG